MAAVAHHIGDRKWHSPPCQRLSESYEKVVAQTEKAIGEFEKLQDGLDAIHQAASSGQLENASLYSKTRSYPYLMANLGSAEFHEMVRKVENIMKRLQEALTPLSSQEEHRVHILRMEAEFLAAQKGVQEDFEALTHMNRKLSALKESVENCRAVLHRELDSLCKQQLAKENQLRTIQTLPGLGSVLDALSKPIATYSSYIEQFNEYYKNCLKVVSPAAAATPAPNPGAPAKK